MKLRVRPVALLIPFVLAAVALSGSFVRSSVYLTCVTLYPIGFVLGRSLSIRRARSSAAFWWIVGVGIPSYALQVRLLFLMGTEIVDILLVAGLSIWAYMGGVCSTYVALAQKRDR